MTTIYKSTDASAPQMTAVAGSLIAVLTACLVDGYGAKAAAGWTRENVDVPTNKYAFKQGAEAGAAQRYVVIDDGAAGLSGHSAYAWACGGYVASPLSYTNNFWDEGSAQQGLITKANQDAGATDAKWIVIANGRSCLLLTHRADWGRVSWALTFFGDLVSAYPNDQGKFAVIGRNAADGAVALGSPAPSAWNGMVTTYGRPDGTAELLTVALGGIVGSTGVLNSVAVTGKAGYYSGLLLNPYHHVSADLYRGRIPWIHWSSQTGYSFYAFADAHELAGEGAVSGTTFSAYTFNVANSERLFIETAGFTV